MCDQRAHQRCRCRRWQRAMALCARGRESRTLHPPIPSLRWKIGRALTDRRYFRRSRPCEFPAPRPTILEGGEPVRPVRRVPTPCNEGKPVRCVNAPSAVERVDLRTWRVEEWKTWRVPAGLGQARFAAFPRSTRNPGSSGLQIGRLKFSILMSCIPLRTPVDSACH